MMLSLDMAYRSFGGEVEASSTPTICRLSDSRRHQLSAIALSTAPSCDADLPGSSLFGGLISAAPTANAIPRQASATAVAWAYFVFFRNMFRILCSSNDLGSDIAATIAMVADCLSPTAIRVSP